MNLSAPLSRLKTSVTRNRVAALLAVIGLLALATRITAVFLLPNYDGDAYCYLEKAAELRAALLTGNFHLAGLFYFWLPLYPLAVALLSIVLPGAGIMLVGKLVSALAGLAACFLVYRLLIALTCRPLIAAAGALAVALDPWQVLYSSNTMTEIPFEALVLGALERAVQRRWTAAAGFIAAAGLIRIEAWPLAALIPLAAWFTDRKIHVPSLVAVFLAPLAWAAINLSAMGDAFAFFNIRHRYVAAYLASEPARAHLQRKNLALDWHNFVQAADLVLIVGAFIALAHLAFHSFPQLFPRREPGPQKPALAALAPWELFTWACSAFSCWRT